MNQIFKSIVVLISTVVFFNSCDNSSYLRGSIEPSKDGKTYLSIVDDNGGGCGPIYVDGKEWKYAINEIGQVSPGTHIIDCGGKIEFEIPSGKIFYFDYWGP